MAHLVLVAQMAGDQPQSSEPEYMSWFYDKIYRLKILFPVVVRANNIDHALKRYAQGSGTALEEIDADFPKSFGKYEK